MAFDEKGFHRPTYEQLLQTRIEQAKMLFGEDIDTDETTTLGKFIRLAVSDLESAWEALEAVYYARFPNTASGVSLDRLLPFAGISRNAATRAEHEIELTGQAGFTVPNGTIFGTSEGVTFYLVNDVELNESGTGTGIVDCTESGTVGNVTLGRISEIVNPVSGLTSIEHTDILTLGKDTETDNAVRARFYQAIAGGGSSTADSIIAAILRVPNVQGCMMIENETDETDSGGRPARSFECFVLAPEEQYQAIAEAIFDKKPVGIKSHGQISKQVADEGGYYHTIKFSAVTEMTVYLKISVKVDATFPSDGVEQIKSNLISYINSQSNGEDLNYTSLFGYIHSVTGVRNTTSLQVSTDNVTYTTGDVICSPYKVTKTSAANISVEVSTYVDR